jgi:hypothetical protein
VKEHYENLHQFKKTIVNNLKVMGSDIPMNKSMDSDQNTSLSLSMLSTQSDNEPLRRSVNRVDKQVSFSEHHNTTHLITPPQQRRNSTDNVPTIEQLYTKCKRELMDSEFQLFTHNIRNLNAARQSPQTTLENIRIILGDHRGDLFLQVRKLINL